MRRLLGEAVSRGNCTESRSEAGQESGGSSKGLSKKNPPERVVQRPGSGGGGGEGTTRVSIVPGMVTLRTGSGAGL